MKPMMDLMPHIERAAKKKKVVIERIPLEKVESKPMLVKKKRDITNFDKR